MKNYFIFLFLISTLLFGLACNNIDDFEPFKVSIFNYTKSKASILKDINDTNFEFEIDPTKDNTLEFPDGSDVTIYANTLASVKGTISCSKVKVKLTKVQDKKDMLINGIGTNADNDRVLISAGMVNVRAFCEDEELSLLPKKKIQLRLAYDISKFKDEFEMFYANPDPEKAGLTWFEADNDTSKAENVNISEWRGNNGKGVVGVECFPERLGWINCDYFLKFNNLELVDPCVIVKPTSTGDVIEYNLFITFKELNLIMLPCCVDNKDGKSCFKNLPSDKLATYIAIGKGKSDYYLGFKEAKISKSIVEEIDFEVKTLEEIKKYLESLK